jgi:tetratricopeptide (TPR) repeat protein
MKTALLFSLLFLTSLALANDEIAVQFEQASQQYRAANFRRAAVLFEQIVRNGYESPELYYDLGNAYFKLDSMPAAILNYERAKKLSPRDEDINYNLRLANLRIVDKIDPLPELFYISWWKWFLHLFSSDGWAFVMILGLWCTVISGAVMVLSRSPILQRLFFVGALLLFVVTLVAAIGLFRDVQDEHNETFAIVFAPSLPVKSSPDFSSTDLFVLHEGVKLEITDALGEWKKIRLADGKIGWVQLTAVEPI